MIQACSRNCLERTTTLIGPGTPGHGDPEKERGWACRRRRLHRLLIRAHIRVHAGSSEDGAASARLLSLQPMGSPGQATCSCSGGIPGWGKPRCDLSLALRCRLRARGGGAPKAMVPGGHPPRMCLPAIFQPGFLGSMVVAPDSHRRQPWSQPWVSHRLTSQAVTRAGQRMSPNRICLPGVVREDGVTPERRRCLPHRQ